MLAWEKALDSGLAPSHFVQLYETDEHYLAANVVRYAAGGLRQGRRVVLLAAPRRRDLFLEGMKRSGLNVPGLIADGSVIVGDADSVLQQISVGGYPDSDLFDRQIGELIRAAAKGAPGVCAYGELVSLLWSRKQYAAAIRLEQLWHRLLAAVPFSLFCGYDIDLFDNALEGGLIDALLSAHTHLLPCGTHEELASALKQALDEVLPRDSARIIHEAGDFGQRRWSRLPRTEATILWLRKHMPHVAPQIFERAKSYYRAAAEPYDGPDEGSVG
jgi:hypothetical protein